MLLVLLAAAAAAVIWAGYPRRTSLVAFDPDALAHAEADMWRAYYDKRYLALFGNLYSLSRGQFGFSPLDSVRLAVSAAGAARTFQPTKSRTAAQAALPQLVTYFGVLAKGAPVSFDLETAARTELDWWQARREGRSADTYGPTVAKVSALIYGVDNARVREAGVLKAKAMDYRDARGQAMTEQDWALVTEQIRASYRALKQGLAVR